MTKPTVSVYLCSQMSAAFKAAIQWIDLFQTDLWLQNTYNNFSILWFYNDVFWFIDHPKMMTNIFRVLATLFQPGGWPQIYKFHMPIEFHIT